MFKILQANKSRNLNRVKYAGITISVVILIFSAIFSAFIGTVKISFGTVVYIFMKQIPFIGGYFNNPVSPISYEIIVYLREPEILGAIVVGASLGIGGAVIQSIFKNPITEPYIIGISSGAAVGAVAAIVFGITVFGLYTIQLFAFIFAILIVFIVYTFSFRNGRTPPTFLLLAGISVSLFTSSIVALMLYINPNLQSSAYFWLMGSLQGISWDELIPVTIIAVFSSTLISLFSRELDALQMGESHAHSIGVPVEKTKALMIILVSLSVSAAVSISGLIGFVGLIMPHISRLIYGGSNKFVLISSAILGAIFLILSNDIAMVAVPNEVIPLGVVTGMIGVPFFMYLLKKLSGGHYEN